MENKVVLIGCGNVGMAYAYSLMNQKTRVSELALIDINQERVSGEVLDLNHCNQFAGTKMKIKVGDKKLKKYYQEITKIQHPTFNLQLPKRKE